MASDIRSVRPVMPCLAVLLISLVRAAAGAILIQKVGGNRARDYVYSNPGGISISAAIPVKLMRSAWIFSRPEAVYGRENYGALYYELDATELRGEKVQLRGKVRPYRLEAATGAWAGLFIRVEAADGRVLAFDNMSNMPISGHKPFILKQTIGYSQVVVQVPGVPRNQVDDACPDPASLAATIVVGVFLAGGKGLINVEDLWFRRVNADFRLTNGIPWRNPALSDLGPGIPFNGDYVYPAPPESFPAPPESFPPPF